MVSELHRTTLDLDRMFFATDIANFLACRHISTLDREQKEGTLKKRVYATKLELWISDG